MALIAPQLQSRPLQSLILIFTAWKGFLLAIALAATVSPPYDTSTDLLFHRLSSNSNSSAAPLLARQLTRWDALYFIHASQGAGKRYEQEFAFGSGLSSLLHALSSLFPSQDAASSSALLGVFVAHVTHLASVLILYRLTHLVFPQSKHLAFTASVLHVISPAGLFLSSPYAESPFSCLSFGGSYLFAISCMSPCRTRRALLVIAAGGAFGLGTWFRSNGLASGLLFAVATLQSLGALLRAPSLSSLLEVLGPLVGGMLVAAGSAIPQFLAWQRFCHSADPRPWCEKMIPSIYNFVQEHYWNVGFLRYWTPNQIPLFLLASPILAILTLSGLHFLRSRRSSLGLDARFSLFVQTSAAVQAFVALLALTSYHVQIINRLASGYFVWYWWIAGGLLETGKEMTTMRKLALDVTVFMAMYASIQAALYASFLPPA